MGIKKKEILILIPYLWNQISKEVEKSGERFETCEEMWVPNQQHLIRYKNFICDFCETTMCWR